MNAKPGDMEIVYSRQMTKAQCRAFVIGMYFCGALLFSIGFAIGIAWPQIVGRFG